MNSPLHKQKKSKNYAMLVILLVMVAIFFAIGMVKMAGKM